MVSAESALLSSRERLPDFKTQKTLQIVQVSTETARGEAQAGPCRARAT